MIADPGRYETEEDSQADLMLCEGSIIQCEVSGAQLDHGLCRVVEALSL